MSETLRIAIIIATTGRPDMIAHTVPRFSRQTRPADRILVVGAQEADVASVRDLDGVEIYISEKGLCKQRNVGLNKIAGDCDIALFFDDDFLAADDFLANMERLFLADPSLVGLTGKLVADGAHTSQIDFADAERQLDVSNDRPAPLRMETTWLYGCNMAMRMSAVGDQRFDEDLPLYGWQEDVDFSRRLNRRGHMVCTSELTGIHLGTRGGRTSGVRLGYSQVANIVYLQRKGTIHPYGGWALMMRNIAMNIARYLLPEPHIDRKGRLHGNVLAFRDLLVGRLHPMRILTL